MIVATEKLQAAIGTPAPQVAGLVKPRPGLGGMRIRNETLGRQCRAPEIALRQTHATDVDFAAHPHGQQLAARTQHMDARVGDGLADGRRTVRALLFPAPRLTALDAGAHRGFGGAIGVVEGTTRRPMLRQRWRTGLAGDDQGRQLRQLQIRRPGTHCHRRQGGMGDCMTAHEARQSLAGQQLLAPPQMQAGATGQRHGDLPGAGIEAGRGELQHAASRRQPELALLPLRQIHQAALRQHHPLGASGGARGVDDICQLTGMRIWQQRLVGRHVRQRRLEAFEQQQRHRADSRPGGGQPGQICAQRFLGEEHARSGILQHVSDALARQAGIDGQIGRTRLEDGQHADHQLAATLDTQRHQITAGDTLLLTQQARQTIGARIELAIAEAVAGKAQRQRLGLPGRLRLEEFLEQAAIGKLAVRGIPVLQLLRPLLGIEPG